MVILYDGFTHVRCAHRRALTSLDKSDDVSQHNVVARRGMGNAGLLVGHDNFRCTFQNGCGLVSAWRNRLGVATVLWAPKRCVGSNVDLEGPNLTVRATAMSGVAARTA